MSRDGNGIYSLPTTSMSPAVGGTTISSAANNTLNTDLANALTQSISKDGQTVITGAIDFDGNEIILDVDGDTSVAADTDDRIDFKAGGLDVVSIDSTGFLDVNKNEIISLSATASAVNELTVTNAATGNGPDISATGGDTNVDITVTPKGTGEFYSVAASANEIIKQQVFS